MSWRELRTPRHEELRRLLIERRQRARMTQAEIAQKLGRPQSYISAIERGSRRISVIELIELGEALGFDPRAAVARVMKRKADER
jgi:transcriptional regulator with XRE-family HTH domain